MATYTPCDVLSALTTAQQQVLERLTSKFNSLKRLADLLEKAGDVSPVLNSVINALPSLPPLSFFAGVDAYESVRKACPMLALPPADFASVADLYTRIASAYSDLLRKLDLHPYNRMDELQARLDDLISQAMTAMGRDWQICAEAFCQAQQNLDLASLRDQFTSELASAVDPSRPFQVLSTAAQDKVASLDDARRGVAALFDAPAPVTL